MPARRKCCRRASGLNYSIQRIKTIREGHNYEASQMAEILEIETEEYIGLETRSVLPNPTQLKVFLIKLNIKVSDLIISAK